MSVLLLAPTVRAWETRAGLDLQASCATPAGPYKDGPGEIGYAIACGGQVVMPGDLIAADEDGVVVIPLAEAAQVIADAEKHSAKEQETTAAIKGGGWVRGWVEETLDYARSLPEKKK